MVGGEELDATFAHDNRILQVHGIAAMMQAWVMVSAKSVDSMPVRRPWPCPRLSLHIYVQHAEQDLAPNYYNLGIVRPTALALPVEIAP